MPLPLRHFVVVLVAMIPGGCLFDPLVPPDVPLTCTDGAVCPDETVCFAGRCVAATTPCLTPATDGSRTATAQPDGNACGGGQICIAAACVAPRCGDGVVTTDANEACDDGNDNAADACTTACQLAVCGDGIHRPDTEACDDGNDDDTDGCTTVCGLPDCGDTIIQADEDCDDGNLEARDACLPSCRFNTCGDGIDNPGTEACDDGNDRDDDGCLTTCQAARCGDGVVQSGVEACDDGGTASGDGCRDDCGKVEVCGDGIFDAGESCDDGNDNPADGCDGCRRQTWRLDVAVSGRVEAGAVSQTGLDFPRAVTVDRLGRVFVVDSSGGRILRIEGDGTITRVAGLSSGSTDDGAPATSAAMAFPHDAVVDGFGRLHVIVQAQVRRIEVDGTITTIAGARTQGFSGDGGPATAATFGNPTGIVIDASGRVLIADAFTHRIRRIDTNGRIETIVGTGPTFQPGAFGGDGGPATAARLDGPEGLALDSTGRLFIADRQNNRVRVVDLDGTIRTVAGSGVDGFSPDGTSALAAALGDVIDVAIDPEDRLLLVERDNHRVRRVERDGTLTTVAGSGVSGFDGDGGPATAGRLNGPRGVATDATGGVFIADSENNTIRFVDVDGTIRTIAGAVRAAAIRDGASATGFPLTAPMGLALDRSGRLLIADRDAQVIRRIEPDGTVTTVAGTGRSDSTGDGGQALDADLAVPQAIAVDASGRLFVLEEDAGVVRRIDPDGVITSVAGIPFAFDSFGDGGPATDAGLFFPSDLALADDGSILIADTIGRTVRRVRPDGIIERVAGTGTNGLFVAGGQATSTTLGVVSAVAVTRDGGFVLTDESNHRVLRVDRNGVLTSIAGTGVSGGGGDGGPATAAQLGTPEDIIEDDDGSILFSDSRVNAIRRIGLDGVIREVIGSNAANPDGDGGLASLGRTIDPAGLLRTPGGLVFSNQGTNLVRQIDDDGLLSTVAGLLHPLGPGRADRAALYAPVAILPLPDGALLSAGDFGRLLRFDPGTGTIDVVFGYDGAAAAVTGLARFAPPLDEPAGLAFDPVRRVVFISEQQAGQIRLMHLDPDDDGIIDPADEWTSGALSTVPLRGPAGLAWRAARDDLLVVERDAHCVRPVSADGEVGPPVAGVCGTAGSLSGLLHRPTHVAVSASGAVYVADTDNHRVLRVDDDGARVILGDGSRSSAGEGAPARLFPVDAPGQLALDAHGNLAVTSTSTVRWIANVDGDLDADGDDRVFTVYGGGDRTGFPESASLCLKALALRGDDVFVADACQGFVVRVSRETD